MLIILPVIESEIKKAIAAYASTHAGKKVLAGRIPNIGKSYEPKVVVFPNITIEEKTNIAQSKNREIDSNETFSKLMYEINIYDSLNTKVEVCYKLASEINNYFMSLKIHNMRFVRIACEPIANTENAQIYRIVMRFENKNI